MTRILEIGPGTVDGNSTVFPEALTVDSVARPEGGPQYNVNCFVAEWGQVQLPFGNNTFDLVFASHVLEHVPWYRVPSALEEVHRILKPGGEFEVYVPDFDYILECYVNGYTDDKWRVFNPTGDLMTWVNGRIFSYGQDATELKSNHRPIAQTHHKSVFNDAYLTSLLRGAGFNYVAELKARRNGKKHSIREVKLLAKKKKD